MSQFYQPQPIANLPRPSFDIAMPGIGQIPVEAPSMPGAVVSTNTSVGQLNGALSQFIGATVDLSNARAARSERAAYAAERAQMQAEKDAEKADALQRTGIFRGLATSARESLPGDRAAIASGNFRPTEADQNDPEIWADRIARERLADVPEKFRDDAIDYYKRVWEPGVLNAYYAKAEADRKRNEQISLDGFADEVALAGANGDLEGLHGALTRGMEMPGADPEKVKDRAATTMITLARNGNKDAVESIKTWLGDSYQKEQITSDSLLEQYDDKAAREQVRQFANDAADVRNRVRAGTLTLEQGVREINAAGKARGVGSNYTENETRELNGEIDKMHAEQVKAYRAEIIGQMKSTTSIGMTNQAIRGERITFADRTIGVDENGKEIVYSEAEQKKDTLDNLRFAFQWPASKDGSPDPYGWAKMGADQKSGYLRGLEKTDILDPYLASSVSGMDLRNEQQGAASRNDVLSVDTLRQIRAVSPVYADRLVAAGGVEAKYAHLASILLDANPDTQAAITRTKQIYKQVGDRIERMEPSQAADILAADPSLSGNIPLVQAAATEAGIRILGKTGDSAKMRSAAAKEAVAALSPFTLKVNGRTVAAGALASNRDADREVAGQVMSELMTGKINEAYKADARISNDVDDYTLEMVNSELYRLVNANDPTQQLPRGIDPLIRASDIEDLMTARMAEKFRSPIRPVAELEKLIANAEAANAKIRADNQAKADLVNTEVRFQSGAGRMLRMQTYVDVDALNRELNVARLKERKTKK